MVEPREARRVAEGAYAAHQEEQERRQRARLGLGPERTGGGGPWQILTQRIIETDTAPHREAVVAAKIAARQAKQAIRQSQTPEARQQARLAADQAKLAVHQAKRDLLQAKLNAKQEARHQVSRGKLIVRQVRRDSRQAKHDVRPGDMPGEAFARFRAAHYCGWCGSGRTLSEQICTHCGKPLPSADSIPSHVRQMLEWGRQYGEQYRLAQHACLYCGRERTLSEQICTRCGKPLPTDASSIPLYLQQYRQEMGLAPQTQPLQRSA